MADNPMYNNPTPEGHVPGGSTDGAGTGNPAPGVRTEEFQISGDDLLARVKELVHEGNIRRLIIKNEEGKTFLEIPLTVGVMGAAVALVYPVLAALGAIAALVARLTIVVERVDTPQ